VAAEQFAQVFEQWIEHCRPMLIALAQEQVHNGVTIDELVAAAVAELWSERDQFRRARSEMALARTIARTAMRKMAAGSLPEGERLLALQAQKRKS